MKQQLKSRTMIIMSILAGLQSGAAALTYLEPILTESQFAVISAVIAFVTPMVAMYMRQITTQAIADK